jgi:hypothetical protein
VGITVGTAVSCLALKLAFAFYRLTIDLLWLS